MQEDRIDILRGHPHGTTGAVLLEMAFIFKPEINPRIVCVSMGFFYRPAAMPGRYGLSEGEVSVAGIPAA